HRDRAERRASSGRSRAACTAPRKSMRSAWREGSAPERYFSPAEVEALIPVLTKIMDDVKAAQTELAAIRERFHGEQERIAMTGGASIDPAAWRDGKAALSRLGTRIQERL